jgi:hypothetical protein
MQRLLIRHRGEAEGLGFEVQRVDNRGAKSAPPVELIDPLGVKLGGSDLTLGHELAWYLESYLDLPTGPNAARAERVLAALRTWGQRSFETLFGQGQARDFYRDATRDGHIELQLVVASDDPRVLSWPREALSDPQAGYLAHHCRIERQLDKVPEPLPLPAELPQDRVYILLVTARPLRNDVAYRSITHPLVELIRHERLPAEVTLLRPPTFAQLQRELTAHPGRYHIVHFDGHGDFGRLAGGGNDRFRGPQGHLLFEDADGVEDAVSAEQLSQLLREHRIPIAVLNACQSAMLSEQAEDAFASVATVPLRCCAWAFAAWWRWAIRRCRRGSDRTRRGGDCRLPVRDGLAQRCAFSPRRRAQHGQSGRASRDGPYHPAGRKAQRPAPRADQPDRSRCGRAQIPSTVYGVPATEGRRAVERALARNSTAAC